MTVLLHVGSLRGWVVSGNSRVSLLEEANLEVVAGWQPFERRRLVENWSGPRRGVRSSRIFFTGSSLHTSGYINILRSITKNVRDNILEYKRA